MSDSGATGVEGLSCSDCVFFDLYDKGSTCGYCRFTPPGYCGRFVAVGPQDWCSEHTVVEEGISPVGDAD